MHSFIHIPTSAGVEAYKDAVPLKPTNSSTLSMYSDVCWDSKISSAVANGALLPLFKFRSMNGASSLGMTAWWVGLETGRNGRPLPLVRPEAGFGPPTQL